MKSGSVVYKVMENNLVLIWVLLLTVGSSCSQTTPNEPIKKITLNYFSAMCQGYCNNTYVVTEHTKRIIKKPGTVISSPEMTVQTDSIQLSEKEWSQIVNSVSIDSIKALPKVNGCPGCDDGAIGTLEVMIRNDTIHLQFEGPDPPHSIRQLVEILKREND